MFSPDLGSCCILTLSPSVAVFSIITTASALGGTGAPVIILNALWGASGVAASIPAVITPCMLSVVPSSMSLLLTAKPSIAELSQGGTSSVAMASCAKTRPLASNRLTSSVSTIGVAALSAFANASSSESHFDDIPTP